MPELHPTVLAEDLRALAEYGHLDGPTIASLEQAAGILERVDLAEIECPACGATTRARMADAPLPEPTYEQVRQALDDAFDCAAITVTVTEANGSGSPPWRLARCLARQGLLDAGAFG